ncbi:hypothetical protein O181_024399 [Austropuccinia psidii MF-1]|uniref:Uncharacterized protein n=1 Tax=Austropuccinia psidii MF-1 TaxID=1389203 RepID=A0A9Q3CIK9_9BASI|nr:hypothetical protein [Austropuccinia psidii MF-1]
MCTILVLVLTINSWLYGTYVVRGMEEGTHQFLNHHQGGSGWPPYTTLPDAFETSYGASANMLEYPVDSRQRCDLSIHDDSDQDTTLNGWQFLDTSDFMRSYAYLLKRGGDSSQVRSGPQESHTEHLQLENRISPQAYVYDDPMGSRAHQGRRENMGRLVPISQERQIRCESDNGRVETAAYHSPIAEERRTGYTSHEATEYNQYAHRIASEPPRIGYGSLAPNLASQSTHKYSGKDLPLEYGNLGEIPGDDPSRRYSGKDLPLEYGNLGEIPGDDPSRRYSGGSRRSENGKHVGNFDGQSSNGASRAERPSPEANGAGLRPSASRKNINSIQIKREEILEKPPPLIDAKKDIAVQDAIPQSSHLKLISVEEVSGDEDGSGNLHTTGSHGNTYKLPIDRPSKDHMQDKINRISNLLEKEIVSPEHVKKATGQAGGCLTALSDVHLHLKKYHKTMEKLAEINNVIRSQNFKSRIATTAMLAIPFYTKSTLLNLIKNLKASLVRLEMDKLDEPILYCRLSLSEIIFLMFDFLSESKLISSDQIKNILTQKFFETISKELNLRLARMNSFSWVQNAQTVSVVYYVDAFIDSHLKNFFSELGIEYHLATHVQVLRQAGAVRYDSVTRGGIGQHLYTVATQWTAEEFLKFWKNPQASASKVFSIKYFQELVASCRKALSDLPPNDPHNLEFSANFQLLTFLIKLDDNGCEVISSQTKKQILSEINLLDKALLIKYVQISPELANTNRALSPQEVERFRILFTNAYINQARAQEFGKNSHAGMLIQNARNFLKV